MPSSRRSASSHDDHCFGMIRIKTAGDRRLLADRHTRVDVSGAAVGAERDSAPGSPPRFRLRRNALCCSDASDTAYKAVIAWAGRCAGRHRHPAAGGSPTSPLRADSSCPVRPSEACMPRKWYRHDGPDHAPESADKHSAPTTASGRDDCGCCPEQGCPFGNHYPNIQMVVPGPRVRIALIRMGDPGRRAADSFG